MPFKRVPQLIRFGVAGGLATLFQLAVLVALVDGGLGKSLAHAIALLASSQLSFFLSREVTWAERRAIGESGAQLLGKLVRFNGMLAVSMLVNQLTFQVAAPHVYYLIAAALGILSAATINYTVSDRLIFAVAEPTTRASPTRRGVARSPVGESGKGRAPG